MSSPHGHRVRTLWLSGVLHAFTHLYQVALLPLYYLILQDSRFELQTVEQATFLVTVLMLSYFVPAYAVGVLADRFSKRKLLALGLLINSLGFVGLAFAQNFGQAVTCMVLSGVGGSAYHPAATALIARLFPEGTGKALGLLGIGASAGFFLGPIYTGWRASFSGWRDPVLEIGVLGVICAFLFYWLADEEPTTETGHIMSGRNEPIFPTTALWLLFLVAAFCFSLRDFTGSAMGSLGSLFLQNAHGLNTRTTGQILSMIFLASAVSNPIFGRLSDRGVVRWTSFVLCTAAGMVIAFPHLPPGMSAPALGFYGFFFMASYPMVEGALMGAVPHAIRGRVFGLFITIGGILGNLAHWLMGVFVRGLGPEASKLPANYYGMYLLLAGLIFVSLVGLPCLRALRKRETVSGALPANVITQKS